MRLEPEFWSALAEICRREQVRIGTLIRRIEAEAGDDAQVSEGGRTSAVRVFVLQYFRAAPSHGEDVGEAVVPTARPVPIAAHPAEAVHETITWAEAAEPATP